MLHSPKMSPHREHLRWGPERRLEFIEFRLYWDGRINRGDLTRAFGISHPQASADLTKYMELAPGNLDYDRSGKYYFATPHFSPVFIRPNANQYLMQLSSEVCGILPQNGSREELGPAVDVASMPSRAVEPEVLRRVLSAIRSEKALEIEYQSMSRPVSSTRWITPHALGSDGFRWHVRAYCHETEFYKDFVLGRILSVLQERPHKIDHSLDTKWHRQVPLRIGPHPGLTDGQKKIIELDYSMEGGETTLLVRVALAFYFLRVLRLERGDLERPPREQQIVLLNREEVDAALQST